MASRRKRSNCPKWNFFSKNSKILMYLSAPFILENLKRILRADPELSGCAIFGHKMNHLSWTKNFDTNQYYYFHLLDGPFHCAKVTKNLTVDPKLWGCPIFGPKMTHLPQTLNILESYLNHFHVTIIFFQSAKFQKNPSSGSRVMWMWNFWA